MPAAPQLITDQLIQESIVRAIGNVCQTMLREEARFVERCAAEVAGSNLGAATHVLGSVGFVGAANGMVYLCLPDDFALFAASHILGITTKELQYEGGESLKDVVGEITNMTVGGFKNALCDIGYSCKLTLPTIVRGDNLSVAAIKGTLRHAFVFECKGHRLIADIQMKAD